MTRHLIILLAQQCTEYWLSYVTFPLQSRLKCQHRRAILGGCEKCRPNTYRLMVVLREWRYTTRIARCVFSRAAHALFTRVWRTGRISAQWKDIIESLYNGKGSMCDCSNSANSIGNRPLRGGGIRVVRHCQSWGQRPWSYDKTGLRPASVLVLYFWSWSWSWSCSFGLGLSLGLILLVLLPTLLCPTGAVWHDNAEM